MPASRPQYVSWAIDGALAIALLAAVLQGGQFIERLDTVVTSLEKLSKRVSELETRPISPGAAAQIRVLEAQDAAMAREVREIKIDITARLDRIEDKLDLLRR